MSGRRLCAAGIVVFVVGTAVAARAAEPAVPATTALAPRHATWLAEAAVLLTPEERAAFLALGKGYQRDAFIRRFWEVRDPYPQTPRNEFLERWQERLTVARGRYENPEDARFRALLLAGEPAATLALPCAELVRPVEAWLYTSRAGAHQGFALIFVATAGRQGRYRAWQPIEGIASLLALTAGANQEQTALATLDRECPRGDELAGALVSAADFDELVRTGGLAPQPSGEWVASFTARSTDLPRDAPALPAEVALSFPGRQQSRTVVAAVVAVPRAAATPGGAATRPVYSFLVDGEVLLRDELFERFRYRFDVPQEQAKGERIPLVVERLLRPGEYTWIVRVEDLFGQRFFREERVLTVPRIENPSVAAAEPAASLPAPAGSPAAPAGVAANSATALLAEAHGGLPRGDQSLRILSLGEALQVGKLRVEAQATGDGIARVTFALDGKPILTKARPPYSVELDLGPAPRLHMLTVTAFDEAGQEAARDEVPINAGPHRFAVRLVEPQPHRHYEQSLRAVAEVDVPEDEKLDRVELFLDDTRVATLYQPPFVQPLLLPNGGQLTYVRVVATLASGETAEDLAIVNAPDNLQEYRVDLVELYTTVVDRRGRPAEGLTAADFAVREDGVEQEVRRFERVRDLPIRAGVVIDTSASMLEELPEAERAAQKFFADVLGPRDRACVVTFADAPRLAARFTASPEILAGALAGLSADGETTLYDSVVFTLHYFSGVRGKRALIVLTDGMDSKSHYRFEDALEFARRAGVAIYTIGLDLPTNQAEVRMKLEQLAEETGGRAFYVHAAAELDSVYRAIQLELRSQYLLAYQSNHAEVDAKYRRVEVQVKRPGLEAKTMLGYYP